MQDLDQELNNYLNLIKKLQKEHFTKHKLTSEEYKEQLYSYSETLAEIEDERMTLQTQLRMKK